MSSYVHYFILNTFKDNAIIFLIYYIDIVQFIFIVFQEFGIDGENQRLNRSSKSEKS